MSWVQIAQLLLKNKHNSFNEQEIFELCELRNIIDSLINKHKRNEGTTHALDNDNL